MSIRVVFALFFLAATVSLTTPAKALTGKSIIALVPEAARLVPECRALPAIGQRLIRRGARLEDIAFRFKFRPRLPRKLPRGHKHFNRGGDSESQDSEPEKTTGGLNGKSMFAIGKLHHAGIGRPKDDIKALMWLDLAVEHGADEAIQLRDELIEKLSLDEITEAERLTAEWLAEHGKPEVGPGR